MLMMTMMTSLHFLLDLTIAAPALDVHFNSKYDLDGFSLMSWTDGGTTGPTTAPGFDVGKLSGDTERVGVAVGDLEGWASPEDPHPPPPYS